jgi:hypothetical protein
VNSDDQSVVHPLPLLNQLIALTALVQQLRHGQQSAVRIGDDPPPPYESVVPAVDVVIQG